MQHLLDLLHERGFIQQISEEGQLRLRLKRPITVYSGFDPTARSLHIGNLVCIMMLGWFQRYGHRPIALMGGGTGLIGDPSLRTTSRPLLSPEEIEQRISNIKQQFRPFLDFDSGRAEMVNNVDWLAPLTFVGFMRDIGRRFSVNEILRLEAYRTRLEAGGLSFLELSYVLMQSYDFLQLFQQYDCILQLGGSDQWGNCVAGADLIRRVTGGQAFVLTAPLITTGSGEKMGKSEGNALWLDASITTPYEYYQHWRNVADTAVRRCLAVFTYLPMDEIRTLVGGQGEELNRAKEVLAFEATRLLHGEEEARKAQAAAHALFGGEGEGDIPTTELARERIATGIAVSELFKEAGLVSSSNEARSLIDQGGLSVNGRPVSDARARVDIGMFEDGRLLLSRGRKRHMRVICR